MIPCINQATVLPTDTLEFIVQARKAGFKLVEFDITKLEDDKDFKGSFKSLFRKGDQ